MSGSAHIETAGQADSHAGAPLAAGAGAPVAAGAGEPPAISKEERFLASLTEDGRYRLLIDAITDYAIYMLHLDGQVSSWNVGAQRLKGYEASEIIGHHFSRFYTPEERMAGLPAKALSIARSQGRYAAEGWRVRKDGTRFWAAVVIDAIRTPEGEMVGYAKITRDLTEKHEAETALNRAREALFQSQKLEAIGKLTGGVAHDFNNLLMAIMSGLSLAKKRLPDDPKLKMLLDNAEEAAKRGAGLIQRMLAFARKQELQLETVDAAALVNGMKGLFERTLGPAWKMETEIPNGLPLLRADINQLESALLNLVVNARDATPAGGRIRIFAEPRTLTESTESGAQPGPYVVIAVEDTGEGMDDDTLRRAMEPFFTTKGVGKGTGLGLSMVHGMAEQLGGRFVLKSKLGAGTTAEVWLPVMDAVQKMAPGGAVQDAAHVFTNPGGAKRILVVDDDPLVLVNTVVMLEELGHAAVEARDAESALQMLAGDNGFDLVITDHAMPGMTGMELARLLAADRPQLPVLLVSGYADVPDAPGAPVVRLGKPFTLEQLSDAVQKHVAHGEAALREVSIH
ncbi:MAG: ATP-binding protein [Rhodospirillaceae bacterium]